MQKRKVTGLGYSSSEVKFVNKQAKTPKIDVADITCGLRDSLIEEVGKVQYSGLKSALRCA